jgi:glycosyltransferase involved in cell wall biosynthesis
MTAANDTAPAADRAAPARIGLCMIVKNEAHVMRRCLDSVRPLLDYVLVEDTGSTDGTQGVIRAWLAETGMAGEVIDEPWQDFAFNRTHALERLRERGDIDYALVIDADDSLVYEPGFDATAFRAGLDADVYWIQIRHGGLLYRRPQLLRNALPFRYRGVLHEFVVQPDGVRGADAQGLHMHYGGGGARSQDPDKFRRDAELLENALRSEPDEFLRSRYTFYLAQSYRDAGVLERALELYLQRADMGFWPQEIYVALYKAAWLRERPHHDPQTVLDAYRRATEALPERAEALHGASRYCRFKGRNEEGYALARQGLERTANGGLFEETWVYEYGLLDELAVNGYWCGRFAECRDACLRLLAEGRMPDTMRPRVEANLRFAEGKLAEAATAGKGPADA